MLFHASQLAGCREWLGKAGTLRPLARAASVAATILLAGCAHPDITNTTGTQMVATEKAFALPAPGGPAVTAVLETRHANGVQQDILLSTSARTSGQNMLRVQLFGAIKRSTAGQTPLREGYLPIRGITTEMRQLFPGMRMAQSPYYVQNRYGPFGYAVGRSPLGDTCLYGWQKLSSTGLTQTWVGNKGSIQIRLRICDQSASEQTLLRTMYDFTIISSFRDRNWNPYGEPNSPDPTLGRSGAPVYPVGSSEFATVTSPRDQQSDRPVPPRVRRPAAPAVVEAPEIPPPVGPVVPPPPIANNSAPPPISPAPTPRPTVPAGPPASEAPAPIVPPPPCADKDPSRCY